MLMQLFLDNADLYFTIHIILQIESGIHGGHVKDKIVLSPLDKVDKNVLSPLDRMDTKQCHYKTKQVAWDHQSTRWLLSSSMLHHFDFFRSYDSKSSNPFHAFLLVSCGEISPQIKTLSRTNESKKELVISWPLELVIVPTIDVWH